MSACNKPPYHIIGCKICMGYLMNQRGINSLVNNFYECAIYYFKESLERVDSSDPEIPTIYYHLGMCHFELKQYDQADEDLQIAISKSKFHPPYMYFLLGQLRLAQKRIDEAKTAFGRSDQLVPDDLRQQLEGM